jgi:hypothetical protein
VTAARHDGRAPSAVLPAPAALEQAGLGREIELEVAGDHDVADAGVAQPRGVGLGLREARRRGSRTPAAAARRRAPRAAAALAERALASIDGTPRLALGEQVGPDLGLHQHAASGAKWSRKRRTAAGRVARQPGLAVAGSQQRGTGGAAGRGAVREQQAHAGQGLA